MSTQECTTGSDDTTDEPNADDVGEARNDGSPTLDDRPSTRSGACSPEPLDDDTDASDDPYRLHEPIAESPETVDDSRYLDDSGDPLTAFEAVGSYIERRHGESVSEEKHGFEKTRRWTAENRYAKGKEMDRQLLSSYENPSTVLLSLRLSPGDRSRLTLLDGLAEAIDQTLAQLRYRLQQAPDAPFSSDEWEYIAVVAGTAERASPHLHIYLWVDGALSRDRLEPVVEKFVEKCPYAPNDGRGNEPDGGAIRVRGNGDDDIPRLSSTVDNVGETAKNLSNEPVEPSNESHDPSRESAGAAYVLSQLPHLQDVDEMARDELLHSSTCDAWGGRAFRKSSYTVWEDDESPNADGVGEAAENLSSDDLTEADTSLSEAEREFVERYVAGDYPTDERTIRLNIKNNRDFFDKSPDVGLINDVIQYRCSDGRDSHN